MRIEEFTKYDRAQVVLLKLWKLALQSDFESELDWHEMPVVMMPH